MAVILGSDIMSRPSHTAIGAGSTAFDVAGSLLVSENDRGNFTTIDLATPKEVTYVTDFSSTDISGLTVAEHGVFNQSGLDLGSIFNREVLTGSLVFVGDRELQVQTTFRFSRSGT